jgi:hypothetical protein
MPIDDVPFVEQRHITSGFLSTNEHRLKRYFRIKQLLVDSIQRHHQLDCYFYPSYQTRINRKYQMEHKNWISYHSNKTISSFFPVLPLVTTKLILTTTINQLKLKSVIPRALSILRTEFDKLLRRELKTVKKAINLCKGILTEKDRNAMKSNDSKNTSRTSQVSISQKKSIFAKPRTSEENVITVMGNAYMSDEDEGEEELVRDSSSSSLRGTTIDQVPKKPILKLNCLEQFIPIYTTDSNISDQSPSAEGNGLSKVLAQIKPVELLSEDNQYYYITARVTEYPMTERSSDDGDDGDDGDDEKDNFSGAKSASDRTNNSPQDTANDLDQNQDSDGSDNSQFIEPFFPLPNDPPIQKKNKIVNKIGFSLFSFEENEYDDTTPSLPTIYASRFNDQNILSKSSRSPSTSVSSHQISHINESTTFLADELRITALPTNPEPFLPSFYTPLNPKGLKNNTNHVVSTALDFHLFDTRTSASRSTSEISLKKRTNQPNQQNSPPSNSYNDSPNEYTPLSDLLNSSQSFKLKLHPPLKGETNSKKFKKTRKANKKLSKADINPNQYSFIHSDDDSSTHSSSDSDDEDSNSTESSTTPNFLSNFAPNFPKSLQLPGIDITIEEYTFIKQQQAQLLNKLLLKSQPQVQEVQNQSITSLYPSQIPLLDHLSVDSYKELAVLSPLDDGNEQMGNKKNRSNPLPSPSIIPSPSRDNNNNNFISKQQQLLANNLGAKNENAINNIFGYFQYTALLPVSNQTSADNYISPNPTNNSHSHTIMLANNPGDLKQSNGGNNNSNLNQTNPLLNNYTQVVTSNNGNVHMFVPDGIINDKGGNYENFDKNQIRANTSTQTYPFSSTILDQTHDVAIQRINQDQFKKTMSQVMTYGLVHGIEDGAGIGNFAQNTTPSLTPPILNTNSNKNYLPQTTFKPHNLNNLNNLNNTHHNYFTSNGSELVDTIIHQKFSTDSISQTVPSQSAPQSNTFNSPGSLLHSSSSMMFPTFQASPVQQASPILPTGTAVSIGMSSLRTVTNDFDNQINNSNNDALNNTPRIINVSGIHQLIDNPYLKHILLHKYKLLSKIQAQNNKNNNAKNAQNNNSNSINSDRIDPSSVLMTVLNQVFSQQTALLMNYNKIVKSNNTIHTQNAQNAQNAQNTRGDHSKKTSLEKTTVLNDAQCDLNDYINQFNPTVVDLHGLDNRLALPMTLGQNTAPQHVSQSLPNITHVFGSSTERKHSTFVLDQNRFKRKNKNFNEQGGNNISKKATSNNTTPSISPLSSPLNGNNTCNTQKTIHNNYQNIHQNTIYNYSTSSLAPAPIIYVDNRPTLPPIPQLSQKDQIFSYQNQFFNPKKNHGSIVSVVSSPTAGGPTAVGGEESGYSPSQNDSTGVSNPFKIQPPARQFVYISRANFDPNGNM